jgi:hypothetical protein
MPHAKRDVTADSTNGYSNGTMASGPVTNGSPQSAFLSVRHPPPPLRSLPGPISQPANNGLQHLTSFPVVSDGISTYKSNTYGAKSISYASRTLDLLTAKIYKPLSPYLATPFSYVAPYVSKADSLGSTGLTKLESRFPIVKEDTATVQKTVTSYAGYPLELADQGKGVLLKIYEDRLKLHEGKYLRVPLAAFETQIIATHRVLNAVATWIHQKSDNYNQKKTKAA